MSFVMLQLHVCFRSARISDDGGNAVEFHSSQIEEHTMDFIFFYPVSQMIVT